MFRMLSGQNPKQTSADVSTEEVEYVSLKLKETVWCGVATNPSTLSNKVRRRTLLVFLIYILDTRVNTNNLMLSGDLTDDDVTCFSKNAYSL